jgi:hypothetical protein
MLRTILALSLLLPAPGFAQTKDAEGYMPMFNGKDLSGWVNVNCHPSTFFVKDNMIITTGHPTGFLRTERQYENFVAEFDWMHQEKEKVGNSGFFVWADPIPAVGTGYTRGIEVQVLVNLTYKNKKGEITATSQGDLFSIWGATCKPDRPHPDGAARCLPSENRTKGGGEWNHYKVVGNNGRLTLEVNGKEVSGVSDCRPRKGYLALESEGAECWFKNLKIKDLPSTNPPADEVADVDKGYKSLWYGLDFTGWKWDEGHKGHWRGADWRLVYDGKSEAKEKNLWTDKSYGNFELVVDWRLPGKAKKAALPVLSKTGEYVLENGLPKTQEVLDAGNSGIFLRGDPKAQVNICCWPAGSGEIYGYRSDKSQPPDVRAAAVPREKADAALGKWNRFVITARGDRVSVKLNGKLVIDNARLPEMPATGPIGLQSAGDQVEFGNLFIRELK